MKAQGYDAIVIGLGAMGSATLYQLAQRGVKALGIDQYDPPHNLGSTHGESRVTRLAVGEGAAYVPLVQRTHVIWRELEAATGQSLLHESGGYVISPIGEGALWHGHLDFARASADIATAHNIVHELLSAAEVRHRHPLVQIEPHFHAYYEPTGGIVNPEKAIRAQLTLAKELGATVQTNERVTAVQHHSNSVTVTTNKATYQADKVIMATGPWIKQFLPDAFCQPFGVYRQVMFWFEAEDWRAFHAKHFPFLLWIGDTDADYFAAFPITATKEAPVKLMTEQYVEQCDPESVPRTVSAQEADAFIDRFLPRKLHGVTNRCVDAQVCLYTATPDENFIIDWHPESDRILLVSPCSGHGFKHSAAVGEAISELITNGQSQYDLSEFKMERFLK